MDEVKAQFGDVDAVLDADPADLAMPILFAMRRLHGLQHINYHATAKMVAEDVASRYGGDKRILRPAVEAVEWLENHGLLIGDFENVTNVRFLILTRQAEALTSAEQFREFRDHRQNLYDLMHPDIRAKVWSIYTRGDYDIAIAQAFKQVEVLMRSKGGFAASDFGEGLIKKFFKKFALVPGADPHPGNLTTEEYLFIGANGMYRNPAVHEDPTLDDPTRAAEVLLQGSHLLRLVEGAAVR